MADDLKSGFDPSLPLYMQMGPPRYGRRRRVFFVPVAGPCGYAKVDARDYHRAMKLKWHTDKAGYPKAAVPTAAGQGERYNTSLHQFILGRREGCVIDHLDGDRRNCVRSNLRHVTLSTNASNRVPASSLSGLRGVTYRKEGPPFWLVSFGVRNRRYSVAYCRSVEEAAPIANLAIALFYGQGTRLHNGEPFQASHIAALVAGASGISSKHLYRLLERTAGHGDELSKELRRQLIARYVCA